jgi:hypothetical protein
MAFHGIHINPKHKGLLHKDLGVAAGTKLTGKEIAKAKDSDSAAVRKRATFAANARKWAKGKKRKSTSEKLYGKKETA